MTPHYHVYCDEAGQFEEGFSYQNSLVFGLLVPDEHKKDLALRYTKLKLKYKSLRDTTSLHGMDFFKNPEYRKFVDELVTLTLESPVMLMRIRHDQDMLKNVAGNVPESFFCNRYLYMIQSLLDTLLFYHPPLWNPVTDYSFKLNTRVFAVYDTALKDALRDLGYKPFNDMKNPQKWIVNVWDNAGLMIYLKRRLADFSPFHQTTGVKTIRQADMQTASKSDDPFVAWADNLAGVLRWKNNPHRASQLAASLDIDPDYGKEHGIYQDLVMAFLEQRFDAFLPEALARIGRFGNTYYQHQIAVLLDKAFNHMNVNSPQVETLAAQVTAQVEKSTGNWGVVLKITEKLIDRIEKTGRSAFSAAALRSLQAARLSCLNHRGETQEAQSLARTLIAEPCLTVDDVRAKAEIQNRLAVTCANRFDFLDPAHELVPYIRRLIGSCTELSQIEGHELKDPLIGHMASTAGQAFAFMVPFDPRHADAAETLLNTALKTAVTPEDVLRQNVYLAHLHLDMDRLFIHSSLEKEDSERRKQGRFDLAAETVTLIAQKPDVAAFLRKPPAESPLGLAFVLALFLKYELQTGVNILDHAQTWMDRHGENAFAHCLTEHPFELIYGYLGQIAFKNREFNQAELCFEKAFSIPDQIKSAAPVIQAIHCQIIGIWAKCLLVQKNKEKALEKIRVVLHIMNLLAEKPGCETLITADGGGWFGSEITALSRAVAEDSGLSKALEDFLNRFTFNYR